MMLLISLLFLIGLQDSSQQQGHWTSFREAKKTHRAIKLNDVQINILANLTNTRHMNAVLDNICIPRVVGTSNHQRVKQYIKDSLSNLNWDVEPDPFEHDTPIGRLKFENIIATLNPNANRYLTLACHYDSKYVKSYEFVGATDSAVPCMQLMNLAYVMKDYLETIKNNDVSLMLIFFDGEEAFKTWGPTDSIYGAKHLAKKWHNKHFSYGNEKDLSNLDKIDLLILLDLIGAKNPTFFNYFQATSKWFSRLSKIEDTLARMRQFKTYYYGRPENKYFQNYHLDAKIEDDHIPFLKKHVPILHLIPYPFPDFWHTEGDNRSAISMTTIENINKILRIFVAEYLNVNVHEVTETVEHSEL